MLSPSSPASRLARSLLHARALSRTAKPSTQLPAIQNESRFSKSQGKNSGVRLPSSTYTLANLVGQAAKQQVGSASRAKEIDSLQYIRDPYRLTSYLPVQLSRKYRPFSAPRSSRDLEQAPGPPSSVARQGDFFLTSDINPLSEVNNAKLLCRFLTPLGKIRTRASTGLTQKSQRRLGKAIRRAREMGIIPYMSRNRSIPNHT